MKKDFRKIKLLVMDFDGVMTDNKVYLDEEGNEMVRCSRADSFSIGMMKKKRIEFLVISTEENKVVKARCRKLCIKCRYGVKNKLPVLKKHIKAMGISPKQVCYVGNDINDLECVKYSGIGCAVKGSHPVLLENADYVTINRGGDGAVREICDMILG